MGKIERLQFYSLLVTGIVMVIGIARTIVVVRILTPEEFGFIGLVVAVGVMVGILQHLGIDSASVRELSMTKDESEASKVFTVALAYRLLISFPLAIALFLGSELVSHFYHNPFVRDGLRIFSIFLILQGVQGIFEATLRGLQRFRMVFGFQITQALVSFFLFVWLTYYFRAYGYLYAMVGSIFLILLLYISVLRRIFNNNFILPKAGEFKLIFKRIFNIGKVVYGIKILHTIWLRAGILILGRYVSPIELGYFNFALAFGEKTRVANRAISSINLPFLTKLYTTSIDRFKKVFKDNFQGLFAMGYPILISMVLFSRELVVILGGADYAPTFRIFSFILLSFFIYFLFNLIGAGVLFPTNSLKGVVRVQFFSIIGSVLLTWILIWRGFGVNGACLGLLIGGIAILIYYIKIAFTRINIKTFDTHCLWLSLILLPSLAFGLMVKEIIVRALVLSINLAVYLIVADKFEILKIGFYIERAFTKVKSFVLNQKGINISRLKR
jgi:PST family polysaccharide transporter